MPKIRVLVVDDSVVIRRLLADCLAGDPALEVAGTAASGEIALAKIPQVNPDVITLDVEMPEMDGIQTLIEIRKTHPRLPVIMFSTLTERGAGSTIDALTHGASDYVTKPTGSRGVEAALQRVRDELVPKIKALCGQLPERVPPASWRPAATPLAARSTAAQRPAVVAIGVSTGGPNALATLIAELPPDLSVPVVIVQHMPPLFTKLLAERLGASARLPVREAAGGETLEPGRIWLAPGDQHLALERASGRVTLALHREPPENSCRPAVDVLFRSVATTYGARALAVVMTGMGQDGLIGARWIKERHGTVVVQDEATSVVWGMPGYVARAGLADEVLPLAMIGPAIVRLTAPCWSPSHARPTVGAVP